MEWQAWMFMFLMQRFLAATKNICMTTVFFHIRMVQ